MAHRRSGAQRRAAQKARQVEACHSGQSLQQSRKGETHTSQAVASRTRKAPLLKPQLEAVVAAIQSLCDDEMKPFGRLLRKRLSERSGPSDDPSEKLPDVDVDYIRALCEASTDLSVVAEDGGDWSVTLADTPTNFVDIYSAEDVYPAELWDEAAAYFVTAPEEEMTLPGGRYSCAQALQSRCLQCFEGRSLGQLCHIVQLAITEKKLLGYLDGAVVPYCRSQSMRKEQSAGQHQALANPCLEAASLACATLEQAKSCLRTILAEAASNQEQGLGQVALSNVKRMFRQHFELELSETALGHSKLTDLLQDSHFRDICYVQLEKHGYTIFQQRQPSHELCSVGFCIDEPLCLLDAEPFGETIVFGPTPGPFAPTPTPMRASSLYGSVPPLRVDEIEMSCDCLAFGPTPGLYTPSSVAPSQSVLKNPAMYEEGSYLKQLLHGYLDQSQTTIQEPDSNPRPFCLHEPLCLDAAEQVSHVPGFGPTPAPFGWSPSPQYAKAMMLPPLPSLSPWSDGRLGTMVQKTFIHAQSPVKTPLHGSFRRSSSVGDLSETTGSTSARSASCESKDANRDLADSPRRRDKRSAKDCSPPTPMLWVPQTPLTPPGLETTAPSFLPPSTALPVLRLSNLIA